jgi:hypothetical protein
MCILGSLGRLCLDGGPDLKRHAKPPTAALLVLLASALPIASCTGYGKPNQPSTELAFGVDMARRGLWSEALFRFHAAERADPENPRVQNNLGVAYEAQGDFDKALGYYKRALQLAPNNREMRANYTRFVEFYQSFKAPDKGKQGKGGVLPMPKSAPGAAGSGSPGTAGTPAARPNDPAPPNAPPPPAAGEPSHPPGPPPPGPAGVPGQPALPVSPPPASP